MTNTTDEIDGLFRVFSDLIREMKSYDEKRKVAKTVGTVVSVAGAALAPFTFGVSLGVTAVGASVNITTDLIDQNEIENFNRRIQNHLKIFRNYIDRLQSKEEKFKDAIEVAIQNEVEELDTGFLKALKEENEKHAIPQSEKELRVGASTPQYTFQRYSAIFGEYVSF